jgi:hypothetical protein
MSEEARAREHVYANAEWLLINMIYYLGSMQVSAHVYKLAYISCSRTHVYLGTGV